MHNMLANKLLSIPKYEPTDFRFFRPWLVEEFAELIKEEEEKGGMLLLGKRNALVQKTEEKGKEKASIF